MKISKKLEPIVTGLSASIIIGLLAFLSFETSTGFWLMFSFGSTSLIVLVFFESEFAQPANIFFGHLLAIVIGILINEFIGMSYLSLGLAVGTTVTLMMYFKIIHPPAAANPPRRSHASAPPRPAVARRGENSLSRRPRSRGLSRSARAHGSPGVPALQRR